MAYQSVYAFQIPVAVCSEDNVNFDIRALDTENNLFSETVVRSGNTLPQVTFNNFLVAKYMNCPARLRISGTIGAGENEVTLVLNGDNVNPCFFNGSYYDAGSFDAEVTVPLSLSGSCPPGIPT